MTPSSPMHMTSYFHSNSCSVSQISGDIGREMQLFPTLLYSTPQLVYWSEFCDTDAAQKTYLDVKSFELKIRVNREDSV